MTPTIGDPTMTIVDTRPPNAGLTTTAPTEPTYLVAVNPWTPWVARTGAVSAAAILAAAATILRSHDLYSAPLVVAVAFTLLFAGVLANHEHTERNPRHWQPKP